MPMSGSRFVLCFRCLFTLLTYSQNLCDVANVRNSECHLSLKGQNHSPHTCSDWILFRCTSIMNAMQGECTWTWDRRSVVAYVNLCWMWWSNNVVAWASTTSMLSTAWPTAIDSCCHAVSLIVKKWKSRCIGWPAGHTHVRFEGKVYLRLPSATITDMSCTWFCASDCDSWLVSKAARTMLSALDLCWCLALTVVTN